ncbi:ATP-binding protein [Actinomadura adrarensis]|uniref:ATP-binding protein n=1 Tax=Actinomadura adrarensis TaxID=1819600 RepID=A0ABW3CR95_9ACTN
MSGVPRAASAPPAMKTEHTASNAYTFVREFRAARTAPAEMRACSVLRLTGWGLHEDDELVGDVQLVVTELVTNAVVHGGEWVRVELKLQDHRHAPGRRLVVGVWDSSTTMPSKPVYQPIADAQRVDLDDETLAALALGGRGLLTVEQLAREWGVDATTERATLQPTGKWVWAIFDWPQAPSP